MDVKRPGLSAAALIMTAMVGQPCLAAGHDMSARGLERRGAAFAGLNVRMALGGDETARADARLKLGMTHPGGIGATGTMAPVQAGSGLELGLARTGRPLLFVAGRNAAEMERKLGLNGTETALVIAGGVVLAAGAAFLLFAEDGTACIPEDPNCGD